MKSQSEHNGKGNFHFAELISQINRLRRKLVTYGYSSKEVIDIVFEQFLNLPQIEWSALRETKAFHDIKTKHKVGGSSAEIILRLQKKVPNLHSYEVCDYLLTVL